MGTTGIGDKGEHGLIGVGVEAFPDFRACQGLKAVPCVARGEMDWLRPFIEML